MERSRKTNGVPTFFEHWGIFFTVAVFLLTTQALLFFEQLNGALWIWFFVGGFALMIIGGLDSLREAAGVSERAIFHFRRQDGAGAFGGILSIGLARVFVWGGAVAVFAVVEIIMTLQSNCC